MEFLTCADAEREKERERRERERERERQASRVADGLCTEKKRWGRASERERERERQREREMVKAPLEWMLSRSEDEAPGAQGWLAGSAQVIARYYHNTFTANGRRKKLGA